MGIFQVWLNTVDALLHDSVVAFHNGERPSKSSNSSAW